MASDGADHQENQLEVENTQSLVRSDLHAPAAKIQRHVRGHFARTRTLSQINAAKRLLLLPAPAEWQTLQRFTGGSDVLKPVQGLCNGLPQRLLPTPTSKNPDVIAGFGVVESYEGEYGPVSGRWHGEGTVVFQARFDDDAVPPSVSQAGIYTTSTSTPAQYTGEFVDGDMHGHGCFTWRDGTKYTGEVRHNKLRGTGTLTWPHASGGNLVDRYEGDVWDGLRHGVGIFIKHNARGEVVATYEGEWNRGLRCGQGRLSFGSAMNEWYEGGWKDGKKSGLGTMQWRSGNVYVGEWFDDLRHGRGRMQWLVTNEVYEGEWLAGMQHGLGRHVWLTPSLPNGHGGPPEAAASSNEKLPVLNEYHGDWQKGLRSGLGVAQYADGSRFVGHFVAGRKHGRGTFISVNGGHLEGDYVEGHLVSLDSEPPVGPTDSDAPQKQAFRLPQPPATKATDNVMLQIEDLVADLEEPLSQLIDVKKLVVNFSHELHQIFESYCSTADKAAGGAQGSKPMESSDENSGSVLDRAPGEVAELVGERQRWQLERLRTAEGRTLSLLRLWHLVKDARLSDGGVSLAALDRFVARVNHRYRPIFSGEHMQDSSTRGAHNARAGPQNPKNKMSLSVPGTWPLEQAASAVKAVIPSAGSELASTGAPAMGIEASGSAAGPGDSTGRLGIHRRGASPAIDPGRYHRADRQLIFSEFLEVLVRLAHAKHPEIPALSQRVSTVLNRNIFAHCASLPASSISSANLMPAIAEVRPCDAHRHAGMHAGSSTHLSLACTPLSLSVQRQKAHKHSNTDTSRSLQQGRSGSRASNRSLKSINSVASDAKKKSTASQLARVKSSSRATRIGAAAVSPPPAPEVAKPVNHYQVMQAPEWSLNQTYLVKLYLSFSKASSDGDFVLSSRGLLMLMTRYGLVCQSDGARQSAQDSTSKTRSAHVRVLTPAQALRVIVDATVSDESAREANLYNLDLELIFPEFIDVLVALALQEAQAAAAAEAAAMASSLAESAARQSAGKPKKSLWSAAKEAQPPETSSSPPNIEPKLDAPRAFFELVGRLKASTTCLVQTACEALVPEGGHSEPILFEQLAALVRQNSELSRLLGLDTTEHHSHLPGVTAERQRLSRMASAQSLLHADIFLTSLHSLSSCSAILSSDSFVGVLGVGGREYPNEIAQQGGAVSVEGEASLSSPAQEMVSIGAQLLS